MAGQNSDKKNPFPVLAAGGAGALLALLLSSKDASAGTQPGIDKPIQLDDETMATLIGLLQSAQETNLKLEAILNSIGVGPGNLQNPPRAIIDTVFPNAVGVAKQLVSYDIPYKLKLTVKALPGNANNIQLGYSKTSAESLQVSWPLIRNEPISLEIARGDALWICTMTGPLTDGIVMMAEQI